MKEIMDALKILFEGYRKGQLGARETAGYGLIGAGGLLAATSFLPSGMDPLHGGVPAAGTLMGGVAVAGAGAVLTLIPGK